MRAVLGSIVLAMLAGCQAPGPAVLVFARAQGTVGRANLPDLDLYQIEPRSQAVTRLTDTPGLIETDPCLSVDRRWLAYATYEEVQTEPGQTMSLLIVQPMDPGDPSTPRAIYASETGRVLTPAWSNNGKRLVFCERVDGRSMIKLINADGTGLTDLGFGSDPSWRQDDQAVFFSSRDTPDAQAGDLRVRDLKTGLTQSLALQGNGFTNLQRGTSILYTTLPYSRRNEAVWLIDANARQTRLTEPNRDARDLDPVHLNGTALVAFTRLDAQTNHASIYIIDRLAEEPVAIPLVEGEANAYTRGGALLMQR